MKFLSLKFNEDPGEKIETAIRSVENAFNISVTVHDLHGRLRRDNGDPLLPGRNLHQHPCCIQDRFRESGWSSRCIHDCFSQAEIIAKSQAHPYIKICWKGLQELVVPIIHDSHHLLTLYAGVFRSKVSPPPEAPTQKWFRKLYSSLPAMPNKNELEHLQEMLEILGQGIVTVGMSPALNRKGSTRYSSLIKFISDNAHQQITLTDLAKHFHLSPSRTAHMVVELTGSSFQSLLLEERMVRARNLLLSTAQTQEEISNAVGFTNCYYFNRMFKKYFGTPPGRYRNQEHFKQKYAGNKFKRNQ
jgi:AraC-like DNA-binding protein